MSSREKIMASAELRTLRKQHGWSQNELARRLGVSQTLVSLWEHGTRPIPAQWMPKLFELGLEFEATKLPMRKDADSVPVDFAQELSNLGYPAYRYFRAGVPSWNPAQFLVMALAQPDLDRRVAEALPWLARHFVGMNWDWVRREAKARDLQNRLGFALALARKSAKKKRQPEVASQLARQEEALRGSLLAKEDTFSREHMTQAERKWLLKNRSPEARAWHVLSDLVTDHLAHG
jgi:transcriptional regulator with XRE-family HTH domain